MVLGACGGDDLVSAYVSQLDGPLTHSSAAGPDEDLGRRISDLDSTLGEVRDGNVEAVEENLGRVSEGRRD